MAELTAVAADRAANEMVMVAAAAGGDTFVNDGQQLVLLLNGSGSPMTVTFVTTKEVDSDLAVEDRDIVIPAGEMHLLGKWSTNDYGATVSMTYSLETTVTVGVISLTPLAA